MVRLSDIIVPYCAAPSPHSAHALDEGTALTATGERVILESKDASRLKPRSARPPIINKPAHQLSRCADGRPCSTRRSTRQAAQVPIARIAKLIVPSNI